MEVLLPQGEDSLEPIHHSASQFNRIDGGENRNLWLDWAEI